MSNKPPSVSQVFALIILTVLIIFPFVFPAQTYILDEQFAVAPALPGGFTGTGIFGSNSSVNNFGRNAPALQFLSDGQKLTYGPWTGDADAISFYHKSNGAGGSLITVEESIDGLSWSTVGVCTVITTSATWQGLLNATSRYVRLSFSLVATSKPYIDDLRIRSAANSCGSNFEIHRVLINANCAQCEDANEFVDFYTGSQPLNIGYLELVNPYVVPTGAIGGAYGGNGPTNNVNVNWIQGGSYSAAQLDYINTLNLLAGCSAFVPVPPGNVVPANSRVLAFTGTMPDATYILSDMCGLGAVYVLFTTRNICPSGSGKYANASCSSNCSRFISIFNHLTGCYDVRSYIASPTATATGALYVFEGPIIGYVGNISCLALALTTSFVSFSGISYDGLNKLSWTVQEDTDVAQYEIQRSFNGEDFISIQVLDIHAEFAMKDYEFTDSSVLQGLVHYYRIAAKSFDGSHLHSNVIGIDSRSEWHIGLIAGNSFQIKSPISSEVEFNIYSLTGKLLFAEKMNVNEGVNACSAPELQTGIYSCVVRCEGRTVCSGRYIRE
jgi:hypothetical protein